MEIKHCNRESSIWVLSFRVNLFSKYSFCKPFNKHILASYSNISTAINVNFVTCRVRKLWFYFFSRISLKCTGQSFWMTSDWKVFFYLEFWESAIIICIPMISCAYVCLQCSGDFLRENKIYKWINEIIYIYIYIVYIYIYIYIYI